MLRIALTEWRVHWRLAWVGPAFVAAILALIYREFARDGCCPPDPTYRLYSTKLFFLSVFYCHLPLLLYAQNGMYGSRSRELLTQTLPLSGFEQNLSRVMTALLFLPLGLLSSFANIWLWLRFDQPVPTSAYLSATVLPVGFVLIGLRRSVLRYVLPILFSLIWIPGSETLVRPMLQALNSIWGPMVLIVIIVVALPWICRMPPPRWARAR